MQCLRYGLEDRLIVVQYPAEARTCTIHVPSLKCYLPCKNPLHSAVCLATGPQPHPKRVLHTVRSTASTFNFQYLLVPLRSSGSCLRLLIRLPVASIFPSITCFRRQFLRKIWPIQSAFRFLISCRIFLCSLTLSNTSRDHEGQKGNRGIDLLFL